MKTNKNKFKYKLKNKLNEIDLIIEYKNKEKNNGNESIQQIKQKKIEIKENVRTYQQIFQWDWNNPIFPLLAIC